MGVTAENVANKWGITRKDQDHFAFSSQSKTANAQKAGKFRNEVIPIVLKSSGKNIKFEVDEHPRNEITIERLSKLKPSFKNDGTVTAGIAEPRGCETLIVESTYGKPDQTLPDRNEVLKDLQAWINATAANGGGIVGAYSLGKAQEVIATANKADVVPAVSEIVGSVSDVYRKHGVKMDYVRYDELDENEKKKPGLLVTSTTATSGRRPDEAVQNLRRNGAKVARVSGWCAFSSWALRGVDAGFPISDHSDFGGTMKFIEECEPKQVYTVHGSTKELAKQVEKKLGINARPLPKYGEVSIESFT